jgi:hypothetical protein
MKELPLTKGYVALLDDEDYEMNMTYGGIASGQAEGYRARVWSALIEVASRQSEHQRKANPVDSFLRAAALRN